MAKIQLFAHDIDTSDQKAINAILGARGANPSEMTQEEYFTLQANLQRDMIRQHVAPKITKGVLPVFMAPEFFFKWRDNLPYDRTAFFNVQDYLNTISAEYPEVLWVLGTVWWKEPMKDGKAMVHNTALILQSGSLLRSWQKERLSSIDGLRNGPEAWDRYALRTERDILDATQDPFFSAAVPGGGAISCGIEICLDHLTLDDETPVAPGVLRERYLAADRKRGGDGAGVELHILTAAGMPAQPENVAARDGGAFLRADGGRAAAPRSEAFAVNRDGPSPASALRAWSPKLTRAKTTSTTSADGQVLTTHEPIVLTPAATPAFARS